MSSPDDDGAGGRHGDVEPVKEASLLGIPPEIRLRIYSLVFEAGQPIDTILAKANTNRILGAADVVLGQHHSGAPRTRTEVMAKLERWDEKCLFLVCRVVFVEATTMYYNQGIFDFHSARQCLDWLKKLTPRTRGLVRHIAVPTGIRPQPDDILLMERLPKLTSNLQTLRISNPSHMDLDGHSYNGKWAGFWHKWLARWGDPKKPASPEYRMISAATTAAVDSRVKDPCADRFKARVGHILPHIATMPCLRAVYLCPELEAGRDDEIAQVLAELEVMRDVCEMSIADPEKA